MEGYTKEDLKTWYKTTRSTFSRAKAKKQKSGAGSDDSGLTFKEANAWSLFQFLHPFVKAKHKKNPLVSVSTCYLPFPLLLSLFLA